MAVFSDDEHCYDDVDWREERHETNRLAVIDNDVTFELGDERNDAIEAEKHVCHAQTDDEHVLRSAQTPDATQSKDGGDVEDDTNSNDGAVRDEDIHRQFVVRFRFTKTQVNQKVEVARITSHNC